MISFDPPRKIHGLTSTKSYDAVNFNSIASASNIRRSMKLNAREDPYCDKDDYNFGVRTDWITKHSLNIRARI